MCFIQEIKEVIKPQGMEEMPVCDTCYVEEHNFHFMLSCAFFTEQRDVLFKTVSELFLNL